MKTILLYIGLFSVLLLKSQNFKYLDINQVKAGVTCHGTIHYDPNTGNPSYEVPKGSGRHSGSYTTLWLGGFDSGNNIKLAGQIFPNLGQDYWPGPLSTLNATTNNTTVNQFDKVWKLNKTDIDNFIINFANGNVQNGTYIPTTDLLSWPGNGDITQNQSMNLAPFVDVNNDNIYDPMHAGDYPKIKGDQAVYYIYNDNYSLHSSGGGALGVEIHVMAYAFSTCSLVATNPYLDYTTFYNYTIINRSGNNYYNTWVNLETEADLGNYSDDYTGCDVQDNYGYVYNANATDPNIGGVMGYGNHPPAAAYVALKKPFADPMDGIDNDFDGIIDEPNEEMNISVFTYFETTFPGINSNMTEPNNASQYYQYMTGLWKDASPFTCGGNAYGGSIPTRFAFPANTYSTGPCGIGNWIDPGNGVSNNDRRYVMGFGPFTMLPGGVTEVEFAHVTTFDSITNDPLLKLDQEVQNLTAFYNSPTNPCTTVSIHESEKPFELIIFPNPVISEINISSKNNPILEIEISDVLGNLLLKEKLNNKEELTIPSENFPKGIYIIKVRGKEKTLTQKIIKQ